MSTVVNASLGKVISKPTSVSAREQEAKERGPEKNQLIVQDAVVAQVRHSPTHSEAGIFELARSLGNRIRRQGGPALLAQANVGSTNVGRFLS